MKVPKVGGQAVLKVVDHLAIPLVDCNSNRLHEVSYRVANILVQSHQDIATIIREFKQFIESHSGKFLSSRCKKNNIIIQIFSIIL
jgi:hypothetical protein